MRAAFPLAAQAGLLVNLTVGETAEQRADGLAAALAALTAQLEPAITAVAAAAGGEAEAWWSSRIVLAYEPVWAIGAGATPCTPEQAQEVHAALRALVAERVSPRAAAAVRIAYTGSVRAAASLALARPYDHHRSCPSSPLVSYPPCR